MAEPKAKTLQQKLGFFDDDLKKPLHDDILKWVDNNAEKVIYAIFPSLTSWNNDKIEQLKNYCNECIQQTKQTYTTKIEELEKSITSKINERPFYEERANKDNDDFYKQRLENLDTEIASLKSDLKKNKDELKAVDSKMQLNEIPLREKIRIIEKPWEFAVSTQSRSQTGYVSSKNIVGFIDIKITFEYSLLTVTGIDFRNKLVIDTINWAQTFKNIDYRYGDISGTNSHTLYVEVKTKINSLGELFRQLRMYKEYINGDFLIICPDDSEQKLIEEQGFKFLKYDNK